MHRDFRQPPTLEERHPVGVLECKAPAAADQIGAEEDEKLVDRHVVTHGAGESGGRVNADHQEVASQGGPECQAQHRIEVERGEQQSRRDQRQLFRRGLGRHDHGTQTEQGSGHLDRGLIPPTVKALGGQDQDDQHQGELEPEAHQVGAGQMRSHEYPVVNDRKTEGRGERHQDAHSHPATRRGPVGEQEFSLELALEA